MKTRLIPLLLLLAAVFTFQNCSKEPENTLAFDENNPSTAEDRAPVIVVPAGSVNALAAAIATAGNNGTVRLAAGIHTEDGTVTIPYRIKLIGDEGAVLISDTDPLTGANFQLETAIHVFGAANTIIDNIDFQTPGGVTGGTAVVVENSANVTVKNCSMTNVQFGVLVEKSDNINVINNTISVSTAWQTGDIPEADGIIIINGKNARIEGNEASGGIFGIFGCDKNGIYQQNNTHHNLVGLILCKVPQNALPMPDGHLVGAATPATNWKCKNNLSTDNFTTGYLVIDGARDNLLEDNEGGNNGTYDIELTGDTYRFGFLTPASIHNRVKAGVFQNVTIKDCGIDNTVIGGIQIDINLDPCY